MTETDTVTIINEAGFVALRAMLSEQGLPADDMSDDEVRAAMSGLAREKRIDHAHRTIMLLWGRTTVTQPADDEAAVLREALDKLFYKRKFRVLANPPSWTGYVTRNRKTGEKTIDRDAVIRCLANTIGKQIEFMTGDGYLGTAFNVKFHAGILGEQLGIPCLHDLVETYATLFCLIRGKRLRGVDAWAAALGR